MAQARYCDQERLEGELGGPAVLVQLLDKDGDGIADAALVDIALDSGCSDMDEALAVNAALGAGPGVLAPPYAPALIKRSAHACAYHAHVIGTLGQAVPELTQRRYDAAIAWARSAGIRELTLGTVASPASSIPVRLVDPDPCGIGVSRRGFARGFR
jgi:hypothetical protein